MTPYCPHFHIDRGESQCWAVVDNIGKHGMSIEQIQHYALQDNNSPSGWTLAVYNTKEEADKICVRMNSQSSTKQYEVRQYKRRRIDER